MLKGNRIYWLAVPLVFLFVLGILKLFQWRLEVGDVYPPYSTYRADPLGAKALFDSLDEVGGIRVGRMLGPMRTLETPEETTLMVLGLLPNQVTRLPRGEFEDIEDFIRQGGRLVLTFVPQVTPLFPRASGGDSQADEDDEPEESDEGDSSGEKEEQDEARTGDPFQEMFKPANLMGEWDVEFRREDLPAGGAEGEPAIRVRRVAPAPDLPDRLPWHTTLYFKAPTNAWTTVYSREDQPVLIERRLGRGSVVLAADTYLFSNEALRNHRESVFLAWTIGANSRVVFDEEHLGISETPGVATLVRQYRLHGVVGVLLLLAFLFVWRNSSSFVPPHPDETLAAGAQLVAGRDSQSGFVNLLRRTVAAADVLPLCFAEWQRSCVRGHGEWLRRAERMDAVLRDMQTGGKFSSRPAGAYREMAKIAREKRL